MLWKRLQRTVQIAAVTAFVVGASLVVTPNSASAYTLIGCKFGETSVTYEYYWVGDYATPTANAIAAWNNKGSAVPGSITANTSASGAHIAFNRISSSLDHWAFMSSTCNSSGNWTNWDTYIEYNDVTMLTLTTGQRQRVIEHEIGHAYGLNHMPSGCGATHAVMVQGTSKWACSWTGTSPWTDDVNGVAHIY
jgi:hypothetical protein